MENIKWGIIMIAALGLMLFINYLLALAGEPRAYWLMCETFKLCE